MLNRGELERRRRLQANEAAVPVRIVPIIGFNPQSLINALTILSYYRLDKNQRFLFMFYALKAIKDTKVNGE